MDDVQARNTPVHLWIVGLLGLLWNCFGAYDYVMTRMRDTDYLAKMMPDVDPNVTLAWVDSFPLYAQFGWGLGVWGGVVGSLLLLVRSKWAVWAFALSLIGAVLSLGYQIIGAPPLPGADDPMFDVMPFVIIAVAAGLYYYAHRQGQAGVLS